MTYDTERVRVGREPVTIVEIDLDKCANTYGSSPCTATGSAGDECYNARAHCQDPTNYLNTDTLTLKFSDREIPDETYTPCVRSSKPLPVEITPGQPYGKRASITIKLQDFPHHDRGIDPYVGTRSYIPVSQGTFFGKLLARNPYHQGRALRLKTGYIAADGFSTGDLQTQYYIIEKMTLSAKGVVTIVAKDVLKLADDDRAVCPILSNGKLEASITAGDTSLTVTSGTEDEYLDVNILCRDQFNAGEWVEGAGWSILGGIATSVSGSSSDLYKGVAVRSSDEYVVTFTLSNFASGSVKPVFRGGTSVNGTSRSANGTYTETLTAVDGNTSFAFAASVTFAGDISVISVRRKSEYVRIGDELILAPFANRAANVFSNLTRGTWNTTAESHDLDDGVQTCKHFDFENVIDIVRDLLVNHARINSSFIPYTDWETEKDLWLGGMNLTALITEPTGVRKLLNELLEQAMVYSWWHSVDQEIHLRAIAPPTIPLVTLTDNNFIKDAKVDIEQDDRKSRIIIYYNPRTPINFEKSADFNGVYGLVSADEEGVNKYNDTRLKIIYARWITTDAIAGTVGSRTRNQFRDPPKEVGFTVDAKDSDNDVGEYLYINTRQLQDETGANDTVLAQMIKVQEDTREAPGTHFRCVAQVAQFSGRYARIMAAGATSVYSSASDTEKAEGCYIVAAGASLFSDGGEAYKIP
jgi:hypothetical protein